MSKKNLYYNKEIKDTKHLFRVLGISNKTLTSEQKKSLNKNGFAIFAPTKNILDKLKKLKNISKKLIKKEGKKGGWEGKEKYYKKGKLFDEGANRLGNLIEKNKIYRDIILVPEILASAYEVIKHDIKLGGFDLRDPFKNKGEQGIHIDWLPRKNKRDSFNGVVCFIYLDDVNLKNGPTRIIPRSHKVLGWPNEHIDKFKIHKDEVKITGPAGTFVVMNLNLWHAGSKNISGNSRKALFLDIRRRNLSQLLNFKKYLSKKIRTFLR